MRFRNTALLAAVFVGLLAYLYWVEAPRKEAAEAAKKLYPLEVDRVSEIHLQYADREILLKKTGAGWRLEKPVADQADATAVSNLLNAIGNAELKRDIEPEAGGKGSLEAYGLDAPTVVVTLTYSDGSKRPVLRVGKQAPVGFSAFAQVEGDARVKLTDSILRTGLDKQAKDLRDKAILAFQDDQVRRLLLEREDGTIELVRAPTAAGETSGDDEWKIERPKKLAADDAEVRSFLASVRGLRAEDFVDEPGPLAEYGLDDPRLTIRITTGEDGAVQELRVGAQKEKDSKQVVWMKRGEGDTVYAVGSWAWTGLDKDLGDLRDKTILAFDLARLGAIEVTREDGDSYRIVRQDAGAKAPSPAPTPGAEPEVKWQVEGAPATRQMAVSQLVGDLHALQGFELAAENPKDLTPYGLASPEATFSLLDVDGKPIGRVMIATVGTADDQKHYAMAEGSGLVFQVRDFLHSHLDKKRGELVEEPPAAPEPSPAAEPPPADSEPPAAAPAD